MSCPAAESFAARWRPTKPLPPSTRTRCRAVIGQPPSVMGPASRAPASRPNPGGHDAEPFGQSDVGTVERMGVEHRVSEHSLHVITSLVEGYRFDPDRAFQRARRRPPRLRAPRTCIVGGRGQRGQALQTVLPVPEVESAELGVQADVGDPRGAVVVAGQLPRDPARGARHQLHQSRPRPRRRRCWRRSAIPAVQSRTDSSSSRPWSRAAAPNSAR